MSNQKNSLEIEFECPECEGNGWTEIGPECNSPASQCCGGCYQKTICTSCDGGDIIVEFDEEDSINIIKSLIEKDWDQIKEIMNYKEITWQQ